MVVPLRGSRFNGELVAEMMILQAFLSSRSRNKYYEVYAFFLRYVYLNSHQMV